MPDCLLGHQGIDEWDHMTSLDPTQYVEDLLVRTRTRLVCRVQVDDSTCSELRQVIISPEQTQTTSVVAPNKETILPKVQTHYNSNMDPSVKLRNKKSFGQYLPILESYDTHTYKNTHIHSYMHAYIHTPIHPSIHTYTYMHMYEYIYNSQMFCLLNSSMVKFVWACIHGDIIYYYR